jgi:hypothetical protein
MLWNANTPLFGPKYLVHQAIWSNLVTSDGVARWTRLLRTLVLGVMPQANPAIFKHMAEFAFDHQPRYVAVYREPIYNNLHDSTPGCWVYTLHGLCSGWWYCPGGIESPESRKVSSLELGRDSRRRPGHLSWLLRREQGENWLVEISLCVWIQSWGRIFKSLLQRDVIGRCDQRDSWKWS